MPFSLCFDSSSFWCVHCIRYSFMSAKIFFRRCKKQREEFSSSMVDILHVMHSGKASIILVGPWQQVTQMMQTQKFRIEISNPHPFFMYINCSCLYQQNRILDLLMNLHVGMITYCS